jgi:hypothetical protein
MNGTLIAIELDGVEVSPAIPYFEVATLLAVVLYRMTRPLVGDPFDMPVNIHGCRPPPSVAVYVKTMKTVTVPVIFTGDVMYALPGK